MEKKNKALSPLVCVGSFLSSDRLLAPRHDMGVANGDDWTTSRSHSGVIKREKNCWSQSVCRVENYQRSGSRLASCVRPVSNRVTHFSNSKSRRIVGAIQHVLLSQLSRGMVSLSCIDLYFVCCFFAVRRISPSVIMKPNLWLLAVSSSSSNRQRSRGRCRRFDRHHRGPPGDEDEDDDDGGDDDGYEDRFTHTRSSTTAWNMISA